uniref:Astacin domain-containing protein n=1 Tax=Angiostrongylus cantonensis TaxID=6313 RepID=A0A0K0DKJ5_ANGCA
MNVVLLFFLAFRIRAELFDSLELTNEAPTSDENFQKELEEGYQLLKDNYVKIENDHVPQFGGTIEEINTESKVGRALFQGDILLTRKQAEEILEDVRENEGKRKKRQAFRDSSYPFSTWSNGFSFTFSNTIQAVKRVFRKAALIWEAETCIDFREDSEAEDKVVVHMGGGCFSSIGRVGGVQYISLGKDCTWAPAGSTIEVVLDSYPSGVAVDGCHFAGVEIKTGSDKRHTGYRFCSPRYAGTSLVSTHNIVPIITYSRVYERKTVLRYRIASMGTGTTDTETSETTGSTDTESPKESTPRPTRCDLLMEWDFCNDDNYDNEVKYLACPKSCNLC